MNKLLASAFYSVEVGKARPLVRLIPLIVVVCAIVGVYNFRIYKGLGDMQSMDNAQLARQIARHQGFTTYFIRPYALTQLAAQATRRGQAELFPDTTFPVGTPRTIPDTYNSPGYPYLLSWFFRAVGTDFDEPTATTSTNHVFAGDHWIPLLNQAMILINSIVIFIMARRLFDDRVAWMSSVVFLVSDFVWRYSLLATPVCLLMLLMTVIFLGLVELYWLGEFVPNELEEPRPWGWAWVLVPGLAVLFGLVCLFCLPLLVLAVPLVIFILLVHRKNWFFLPIFAGIVAVMVAPWFVHWYRTCGNALGSNLVLGLMGSGNYVGDQVYCGTTIPSYVMMFSATGPKEYNGFAHYFQRGWDLLGSGPILLFFAASIIHEFRRRRVQAFRWLVIASAFAIMATTNLVDPAPEPVSSWNLIVVLLPAMMMIGSAFFFVMLDRMTTQIPLLTICIVVTTLALSIAPMLLVFNNAGASYYNYPPYLPPYLSYLTRLAPADEWVTSDIPWATAWYGDHPSMWVPDSVNDFISINENDCESNFLLFSPETWNKPATNLTSGEMKDWLPILFSNALPDNFPLRHVSKLPSGGPEYTLVSNRFGGGSH